MPVDTVPLSKKDAIIVVGAGIFGLSTVIHLAERGYTNVTLIDRQPYEKTLYSYTEGCDAASADINKIIRSAYGSQTIYQDLSLDAIRAWDAWTEELRHGGSAVPPGMTSQDDIWINNGDLSCTDANTLPPFEKATIENMDKAGYRNTQLVNNNTQHLRLAEERGLASNMQPFSKNLLGVLDTTGGITLADKACRFALHKAKRLGVRFLLDTIAGKVIATVRGPAGRIVGVRTSDGKIHQAVLTIMACGGWTPSLVPSLDGFAETTAGSVIIFKLPEILRPRFSPSRFPAWSFKITEGAEAGLYGFPADEHGQLKIGYRGTKYTNPRIQADGRERSVPITRWTEDEQIRKIPAQAIKVVRKFTDEYLPELANVDISLTRLCWYTDSFDNHFVIDRVPNNEGLMVATAGSGHAFKYLPTIGSWVVDAVEGKGLNRPAARAWRWRSLKKDELPVNQLMEGSRGKRALQNVALSSGVARGSKL
ncbi:FAD dependent oxidoreductase [Dactylonectria estremocensis]|uniref:FAD dependent oxidoreductase n=1 Tax=Dactylonectria estremocensis TaxID=1079267 RepID=A0A9P9DWT0_9HYPO|nr:FAD dependent oxidoreductase [Dactylonectria estremocensis]